MCPVHVLREDARLAPRARAPRGGMRDAKGESMITRSPIRALRRVAPDRTARVQLHVHCPVKERASELQGCTTCPRAVSLDAVDAEGHPAIACDVGARPRARHIAVATIGEVMRLETVCVPSDALLGEVEGLVPARACVVDATGLLAGILDRDALCPSAADAWTPVTEVMVPAVQIHEAATLDDALHIMVRAHVRMLAVTRDDGTVVGLIDDLPILHWVAKHRES
jgi:CBS domain-containing protein